MPIRTSEEARAVSSKRKLYIRTCAAADCHRPFEGLFVQQYCSPRCKARVNMRSHRAMKKARLHDDAPEIGATTPLTKSNNQDYFIAMSRKTEGTEWLQVIIPVELKRWVKAQASLEGKHVSDKAAEIFAEARAKSEQAQRQAILESAQVSE